MIYVLAEIHIAPPGCHRRKMRKMIFC